MTDCALGIYVRNAALGMAFTPILLFVLFLLRNRQIPKLEVKTTDVIIGGVVEVLIKVLECSGVVL
jgi:hypothetical protein